MEVSGFPHQVGGHFGILSISGHVCKLLNQREYEFYLQLDPRFKPFTAKFCGRIKVQCNNNNSLIAKTTSEEEHALVSMSTETLVDCHPQLIQIPPNTLTTTIISSSTKICGTENSLLKEEFSSSKSSSSFCSSSTNSSSCMSFRLKSGKVETEKPIGNQWAGQCQSKVVQRLLKGTDKYFIVLEDLVAQYSKPCVIDLKMGTRQHGDDASAQKKLTQTQKCRQSTSSKFGVRLVGMQIYDRQSNQFTFVNKYEGRRMDHSQFCDALLKFFRVAGKRRTRKIIEELLKLRKVLSRAMGFRFFSSSLLIAFDGEKISVGSNLDQRGGGGIIVKMIDFAHSTFNGFLGDKLYTGADDGYILGIDSLLNILGMFLQTSFRPPPIANNREIAVNNNCELQQQKRPSLKRKLLLENLESLGETSNNCCDVWIETTATTENLAPLSDNDNSNWSYEMEDDESSINSSTMGFTSDSGAEMGEPDEEEEETNSSSLTNLQQFNNSVVDVDKIEININLNISQRLEGFVVNSSTTTTKIQRNE
uniref:Kinase n=2 Tax=Meloidogyne TaxID=189290 RepID=A0A914LHP9_MELIC